MIDVSGIPRSSSQIKRGLELRRSELREDMDLLFRGRKPRLTAATETTEGIDASAGDSRIPLLPIVAAGAVVGFFLLRRSVWPLRMAGRFVELAAPAMVPVFVRRVLGRE
jgi:hypothetical protein